MLYDEVFVTYTLKSLQVCSESTGSRPAHVVCVQGQSAELWAWQVFSVASAARIVAANAGKGVKNLGTYRGYFMYPQKKKSGRILMKFGIWAFFEILCAHTHTYVMLIFLPRQQWFVSVTLYVDCHSCLLLQTDVYHEVKVFFLIWYFRSNLSPHLTWHHRLPPNSPLWSCFPRVFYTSHIVFGEKEGLNTAFLVRVQKAFLLGPSLVVPSATACGLLLPTILTFCELTCPSRWKGV